MQSRTYKRFFEDAERALYVKGDARRVHSQWVDYARKRQTAVVLHPSTLDELKAREGQIADVVRTLYQAGSIQDAETKADIPFSIEDAVADINHVHIAFEGNGLDITSQAIEGAFKIKRGFYIVHPFSCERLNHRFADYVDSNIAIPFDENSLGTPFFMPESQYSKLFRPLFFTAKIVEGDKYSVGDERRPQLGVQEFDVLWNTNFFGQEGRTTRDLERRLEESDLVAKLEHLVLTSYPKGAARVRILETIMSRLQTLSGGERRGFISDIYDLINPNNPEFFDDRFPHLSFSVYQELPELLDAKVETSYPHLAERLSELFTLEDAIEHVYQREKEIGARLTEREQEELLKRLEAEGKVKRVRIGGSKPCEYIKDIAYMRDTSHYVIKMTIETDSGPREVIVKRSEPRRPKEPTSDLLNEVVPSTILMHLRDSDGNPVRTPMIVALDAEYGVESFAPGKKISKCSEDLRRRYAKKIAFFLGMDARVADLCGDCHNNNVLVSEDGGVTRIDLERIVPRWVDDIGHKDVGYYANSFEFQILSMLLPQWGDRPNPERIELWNCFIDGLNAADTQLRDPVVRSEIEETIKRLDRLYPPKRTGLTSTYKARLKKTLDETTVEDIIKRIAKINYDTYTWAMENSPDMRYRSEINFWERYI
ncbi:MAG: hypothetical protein FJY77_00005 [Candidatus Altiarchaeales archaeon]|nr:hypothetical protein [Candidatus Altiarchaeales archaeon]